MNIPPTPMLSILAGLIGAALGSFANVCIVRMPEGASVVRPRSHCPKCDRQLSWWENIPILSYVLLGGKCHGCKQPISWQYPAVELLCIVLALVTWWHYRQPLYFFVYFCFLLVPLVIITFIDLKHRIIPDEISLTGIFVGVATNILFSVGDDVWPMTIATCVGALVGFVLVAVAEQLYRRLKKMEKERTIELLVAGALFGILGANVVAGHAGYRVMAAVHSALGALIGGMSLFIVALVYEKLKKQEGLGGGDVKLIAMLGAFFGWSASIMMLLVSSILGSLVGIVMIIILRKDLKYAIPFGPFLAIAGVIQLFFGYRLISWYFHLFW